MLVGDRQNFELPMLERMKLSGRELETWVQLVTPTVKRVLSDATTDLCNTNHAIPSLLAPARPDWLVTNELMNELRPVSRLRPWIQLNHKFFFSFSSPIARGSRQLRDCCSHGSVSGAGPPRGVMRQQSRHFISFHCCWSLNAPPAQATVAPVRLMPHLHPQRNEACFIPLQCDSHQPAWMSLGRNLQGLPGKLMSQQCSCPNASWLGLGNLLIC